MKNIGMVFLLLASCILVGAAMAATTTAQPRVTDLTSVASVRDVSQVAAEPRSSPSQQQLLEDASSVDGQSPSSNEISALRIQNQLIKDYQGDLLETVHWSLGVAVGLTLLLAGFGWFTNYKLYEADKAALKESFDSRISDFELKLESALTRNKAESLTAINARLESHAAKLANEVSAAEERSSKDNEATRSAVTEVKESLKSLDNRTTTHAKKIIGLERDLRMVEQHVWELKDIPENILLTQAQALSAAVDEGNEYYIKNIVERAKLTLEKVFVERGLKVDDFLFENISGELRKAEKIDAVAVAEVRKLLEVLREETGGTDPEG